MKIYKLSFYVPKANLEQLKESLFQAGAGRLGGYQRCAWQVEGQGQFYPLPGSQPYVGDIDKLTTVAEYKVEMICQEQYLEQVIAALHANHPYEQPAYSVIKCEK